MTIFRRRPDPELGALRDAISMHRRVLGAQMRQAAEYDAAGARAERERKTIETLRAERDAAILRAEKAERERDDMRESIDRHGHPLELARRVYEVEREREEARADVEQAAKQLCDLDEALGKLRVERDAARADADESGFALDGVTRKLRTSTGYQLDCTARKLEEVLAQQRDEARATAIKLRELFLSCYVCGCDLLLPPCPHCRDGCDVEGDGESMPRDEWKCEVNNVLPTVEAWRKP